METDQYTIKEYFIEVGDGHSLYVQDWGNPKAKTPVVFLHGGPGGGCSDKHKKIFDPLTMRVIFFDQRGAGRSLPYGSLEHNTTSDLVEDIEKIIKHMKLDKVILHGNSWGSSLALFYGIKYPKRVKSMAISGICTCTDEEIAWLDKGKMRSIFPEAWDAYLERTPKAQHADPSAYHFKRALGKDKRAAKESAYAYSCLEAASISLDDRFQAPDFEEFDPASIQTEIHYLVKRCFMPEGYILHNAHKLTMPIWIIQGRYDMVCPPIIAYELNKKLPDGHVAWTVSGHRTEHESWNLIKSTLIHLTSAK